LSDLKDWEIEAATSFFVYATSSMFLVDETKKLIAKPLSLTELEQALTK